MIEVEILVFLCNILDQLLLRHLLCIAKLFEVLSLKFEVPLVHKKGGARVGHEMSSLTRPFYILLTIKPRQAAET